MGNNRNNRFRSMPNVNDDIQSASEESLISAASEMPIDEMHEEKADDEDVLPLDASEEPAPQVEMNIVEKKHAPGDVEKNSQNRQLIHDILTNTKLATFFGTSKNIEITNIYAPNENRKTVKLSYNGKEVTVKIIASEGRHIYSVENI